MKKNNRKSFHFEKIIIYLYRNKREQLRTSGKIQIIMPKENNELLEKYKKLKKGDVKFIAETFGVCRRTVWSVGVGRFENEGVQKAIEKMAAKREEEAENKLKALEQAV